MHWRIFPAGTRNQLEQDQAPESLQGSPSMVPVLGHQVEVVDSFINRPRIMYWTRWWEWYGYPQTNRTSPHMQEGTEPWNLAHVYLIVNQASFVQYIIYILPVLLYGADTWSMTVASKWRLDALDQWCLRYILHVPFTARHQSGSPLQNRSTAGHIPRKVATSKAVDV